MTGGEIVRRAGRQMQDHSGDEVAGFPLDGQGARSPDDVGHDIQVRVRDLPGFLGTRVRAAEEDKPGPVARPLHQLSVSNFSFRPPQPLRLFLKVENVQLPLPLRVRERRRFQDDGAAAVPSGGASSKRPADILLIFRKLLCAVSGLALA